MTVLVTGASGFVGSWLTQSLVADGHRVVAQMRRPPSTLFERLALQDHPLVQVAVDADAAAIMKRTRPETVFHLAGMSQIGTALETPVLAYETNARQTWLLLETMREMATAPNTVVASTDSIYGETGGLAATEEHPLAALGPYEASKIMADIAARSYALQFGLPVVVARLGNVYGPGDANHARIVPSVVDAIRAGGVPHLRGGGRAVRSLLHVDDCVAALRLLAENAGQANVRMQAFNVSGGPPMTTLQIARMILKAFGKAELDPKISDAAPGETSVKISSSAKLRDALGWAPTIGLAEGLMTVKMDVDARRPC